ncbi:uncharacterized protein BDW47DRAFT_55222 [Aspergillus candidus]|uniref:DNA2/NAM7 helicase-like C-terminal domain-containing protein n=1 Tax=Aspergillus candidus TaxID=41067 RepID=A0A2I2FLD3_ASPCN|nr:hypothetical protein BDW47DRAFT_55222 [Aspergillus candidus]PLB41448.1 hypothetical protein BDW47DRAFT_55222 [Aspergillus candidus]
MGRSLFDRLCRARFPVHVVSRQDRMDPRLSRFPSQFTYSGGMPDDPSVNSISIRAEIANALRDRIEKKASGANFEHVELIGIDRN